MLLPSGLDIMDELTQGWLFQRAKTAEAKLAGMADGMMQLAEAGEALRSVLYARARDWHNYHHRSNVTMENCQAAACHSFNVASARWHQAVLTTEQT